MKRVLVLLANGFETYEGATFIDVFGWAREYGTEAIECITAAFHPELTCTFGLRVIPSAHVDDLNLEQFDALALPGGFQTAGFYDDAYTAQFQETIRFFHRKKKLIAAICVGALALGKSGILRNRRATTYHLFEGKRRRRLASMGAEIVDAPIVVDEHIITSTSPATAVNVALLVLEKLTSRCNAEKIRASMGFENNVSWRELR